VTETQHIGIIGLGNMGGRIARRMAGAGLAVAGFDVDEAQRERAGVPVVGSLAALMRDAEVVFFSLPDSAVIERVVYEDDGVREHCRPGQTVVDLSTAAPRSTVKIHEDLAERDVEYLDAGISGGAAAADKGALSIMVGGDADALRRIEPVLDTFSAHVYHMGGSGKGHATKLLNNFLNGISLAATAEAMVAARKAGLDLRQFLDVVNNSSGVNFATLNRFPRIIEGDYLEGGLTSNLMAKDLLLYLEYVQELGLTSFTGPPTLGTFNLAAALGYGEQISNRVVDAIGDVAGGVRVSEPAATGVESR
jgi:3-hydroxyisobutyrate dehydrogenase